MSLVGGLRSAAQRQTFVHIEGRFGRKPFAHPFNRNFGCCAKGSINRLTILSERFESLPGNLAQKPQHGCAVTESRNVCAGFANLLSETRIHRNLLTGVPPLKFLLLLPKSLEIFRVHLWHSFARI